MKSTKCLCCEHELSFRWTDTHGVAVCATCGTPYRLIHYGEDKKRVERPPECQLLPEWLLISKRYWTETRSMVDPGAFDMGIFGGHNATYSGATREDYRKWIEWLKAHESELPGYKESDICPATTEAV